MNDDSPGRMTPIHRHAGGPGHAPRPVDPAPAREVDLFAGLSALWRGKAVIAFCAGLAALIGGYYAYGIAEPRFAATTELLLEVRDRKVVDVESVVSGVGSDDASLNTEVSILRSRGLIETLVRDMGLTEDPEFNPALRTAPWYAPGALRDRALRLIGRAPPPEPTPGAERTVSRTVSAVGEAVAISNDRDTYVFRIRATTGAPDKSVAIANRLAELYLEDQIAAKFAATEYAINWLSQRVTELELELKDKEDALEEMRLSSAVLEPAALQALTLRLRGLDGDLAAARDRAAALDARATSAGADAETRIEARSQADAARTRAGRLAETRDGLAARIDAQNAARVGIGTLVREVNATRVLYETFLQRLKETSIQVGLQQADSRILSRADFGVPVAPRRGRIVLVALLIGAALGAGIVLVQQLRAGGFRTAEELETATGRPVLGQVPLMPLRRRARLPAYLRGHPTSAASEAIRNLRTSILMAQAGAPPKVIAVASSVPGEGKTTMSIALAHNLAGLGHKVLLVEGDIRRRTLSGYFPETPGGHLLNVISQTMTLDEAAFRNDDLGIDVLTGASSSTNGADLFASPRFRDMMDTARAAYDFVVIDTPPVLVVPDARIIARQADAVLYCVLWNRTAPQQVAAGLRQFASVDVDVTGLVLSRVDPKGMKRYGYGGRYGSYAAYGKGYYGA